MPPDYGDTKNIATRTVAAMASRFAEAAPEAFGLSPATINHAEGLLHFRIAVAQLGGSRVSFH